MRCISIVEPNETVQPKAQWATPHLRKSDAREAQANPGPSTDSGITTS